MYFNLMNYFYAVSIFITSVIAISSNSWVLCWIMMEINLMIFIPLLCIKTYLMSPSSPIKYFLIQCMGSVIMLIFIVTSMDKFNISMAMSQSILLLVAMGIKSGTPPLHFWFPQIMEVSNEYQCAILITVQKIIPLSFLSYSVSDLILLLALTSGLLGALGGFNQIKTNIIMAYSSMVHTAWLLCSMMMNLMFCFVYFFFYCFMSSTLFMVFKKLTLKKINAGSLSIFSLVTYTLLILSMLSLAGMPPLLGFYSKLLVLYSMYSMKAPLLIAMSLMFFSIISLTFYVRLIYSQMMIKTVMSKEKYLEAKLSNMLIFTSIMMNIVAPILVFNSF